MAISYITRTTMIVIPSMFALKTTSLIAEIKILHNKKLLLF